MLLVKAFVNLNMLKAFPAFDYQLDYITILRETQLSCADILGNLLLRERYIFLNFHLGKQKLFLTKKLLEMSQDMKISRFVGGG